MSNRYSSIESILNMLDGNYTKEDIAQALADLYAMYADGNINKKRYDDMKSLLEAKQ